MKKLLRRLFISVICLAFLSVWPAAAQEAPTPPAPAPAPTPVPEPPATPPATGVVEGQVLVKGLREVVPNAKITVEGSDVQALTDDQGRFVLKNAPIGERTLVIEGDVIEKFSKKVVVKTGETLSLKLYVTKSGYTLDEIVIVGKKETEAAAKQEISKEELTGVPGANNDAVRVVENMPGVAQTSVMGFGGGDGLVIRGTGPENSAYLFNGFGIPQLFHFGSMMSIINSELIQDVAYYPGGYPVRYGNALGGVVELTSRHPRTDRIGGVADLGTYASFVMFEGPAGHNASWAGAVRRSFIDFILPEVIPEDEASFTLAPRFYDYTGLFEYKINDQHNLQFTALGSNDAMGLIGNPDPDDPFSGDSFDATLNWHRADAVWNWKPGERFANTMAVNFLYIEDSFNFGPGMFVKFADYVPTFRDDLSAHVGSWNEIRAGIAGSWENMAISLDVVHPPKEGDPSASLSTDDRLAKQQEFSGISGAVYVDDVMQPAQWVQLVPGVRADYLDYHSKLTADPRLNVNFFPTNQATIKTAAGIYHQFPSGDELMEDFGNPELKSEVAYLGSLGLGYDFGQGYELDVQGYYKRLDDLVAGTEAGAAEPYENTGIGYVYGAELLARKKLLDRFFGWVSYTYSVSKRKDRPDSDWRYFDQDQTHNFIIMASYMFGQNKQWRLGGKWQYTTGFPYTAIDGAIYSADTDSYIPIYSDVINGRRNKDFHQLDLRLDKLWIFNTWTLNTYLDIQNVYFNQYPFGYMYNFDYTKRKLVSFPAFMPSIGAQARF